MKILGILICFCLFSTNMNDSIVKLDTRSTNPSIYLTKIIKSLNKSKFVTQTVHFQELNTSTNKNVTINEMIDTNQYKYGFYNISNISLNNVTLKSADISISNTSRNLRSLQRTISCESNLIKLNLFLINLTLPNITYYVNFYRLGFGFNDNHLGVKVIFYKNNSFRSIEFDDFLQINLTKNTNFSKPLLIQNYYKMTSAFLAIQDRNLYHLYIFNLSRINNIEQITYHGFINGSTLKNSTVIDLHVYNN
jgi:hypothetical protein